MEENIEKIDYEELQKQMVEDIKNKGHYMEVNIIVGEDEVSTIPNIHIHKVGIEEVAKMMACLEEVIKDLEKRYPIALILKQKFRVESQRLDENE